MGGIGISPAVENLQRFSISFLYALAQDHVNATNDVVQSIRV